LSAAVTDLIPELSLSGIASYEEMAHYLVAQRDPYYINEGPTRIAGTGI